MVSPAALIRVLLALWDQLPALVGREWTDLLPRLAGLVQRLANEPDEAARESLTADVVVLLRPFPAVRGKIQEALSGTVSAPASSRGAPPGPAASPEVESVAPPPPVPSPVRPSPKPPSPEPAPAAAAPPQIAEGPRSESEVHAETQYLFCPPPVDLLLQERVRAAWERTFPAADLDDTLRKGRVVNLSIAPKESAVVLSATSCLAAGKEYRLRLDIGPLSPESVVAKPASFPSEQLPASDEGHWLDIVVSSDDFTADPRPTKLFLPTAGPSWVCGCKPGGPHSCEPAFRSRFLFIALRSPEKPGDAQLRVGIYFCNNLVQSLRLSARIEAEERDGLGHHSEVDYTLTNFLADVSFLKPRTLHVLTNDNPEGTHRLLIKDGDNEVLSFRLSEGQMRDAIEAARRFLRDAHIEESRSWLSGKKLRSRLDENNAKRKQDFVADLKQFATLGSKLWAKLFESQVDWWERLSRSGTIQVSRTGGSSFVFPWALLYGLPLEGDPSKYKECRVLKQWEQVAEAMDEHSRTCPYENETEHKALNTVCPFAFWGFRHIIEQPPSVPPGRNLPLAIRSAHEPPKLIAGLCQRLDRGTTENHLRRLAPVVKCNSLEAMRTTLTEDVEIVYFYVHGERKELPGAKGSTPALELGQGEWFEPEDLVAWRRSVWPPGHWRDLSPLVFINGCHTAEITPESLLSFVDSFSAAGAAGVIGTEITLEQTLASEVAERFFSHFRRYENVGVALHATRIELLKKGNLLGLAYTPYCSAELSLAKLTR